MATNCEDKTMRGIFCRAIPGDTVDTCSMFQQVQTDIPHYNADTLKQEVDACAGCIFQALIKNYIDQNKP